MVFTSMLCRSDGISLNDLSQQMNIRRFLNIRHSDIPIRTQWQPGRCFAIVSRGLAGVLPAIISAVIASTRLLSVPATLVRKFGDSLARTKATQMLSIAAGRTGSRNQNLNIMPYRHGSAMLAKNLEVRRMRLRNARSYPP